MKMTRQQAVDDAWRMDETGVPGGERLEPMSSAGKAPEPRRPIPPKTEGGLWAARPQDG